MGRKSIWQPRDDTRATGPRDEGSSGGPWILVVIGGVLVLALGGFMMVGAGALFVRTSAVQSRAAAAQELESELRMQALTATLEAYATEHEGVYPERLEDMTELDDAGRARWPGAEVEDSWGFPYQYERADDGTSFLLKSLGQDGLPGGEGPDADVEAGSAPK